MTGAEILRLRPAKDAAHKKRARCEPKAFAWLMIAPTERALRTNYVCGANKNPSHVKQLRDPVGMSAYRKRAHSERAGRKQKGSEPVVSKKATNPFALVATSGETDPFPAHRRQPTRMGDTELR